MQVRALSSGTMTVELANGLNQRMFEHSDAETALDTCVDELRQDGRDLWHYADFAYGADYVIPRGGAGLRIRGSDEDEDAEDESRLVVVTFTRCADG
jgi:hypothetical protein